MSHEFSRLIWLAVLPYFGLAALVMAGEVMGPRLFEHGWTGWLSSHLVLGYTLVAPIFGVAYWWVVLMPERWTRRAAAALLMGLVTLAVLWTSGGGQAEVQDGLILGLPVLAGIISARFVIEFLERRPAGTVPMGHRLSLRLLGFLASIPAYFLVVLVFSGA